MLLYPTVESRDVREDRIIFSVAGLKICVYERSTDDSSEVPFAATLYDKASTYKGT